MKPIFFTIPWLDLPVYGYGVMLGLAFLFGWYLTVYLARWCGLKEDIYYVAMTLAIIASLVGARLFHVFSNPDEHWTLLRILNIREGGLVAYGGYICGVAIGVWYFRKKKVNIWAYVDGATPGLALGLFFARMGCFMRGCCYGIRTDSFLGISFPHESLVAEQHLHRHWPLLENGWSYPVIPTQLIASFTGLVLFGIALYMVARKRKERIENEQAQKEGGNIKSLKILDGHIFLMFVGGYSVFRFFIEFIRDDGGRGTVGLLSTSQFISIIMVAFVLWMSFSWIPKHPYHEPVSKYRAAKRRQQKKKK